MTPVKASRPSSKTAHHDVITIGNAIVDVLGHAEEVFVVKHDLAKGAMTLIDEARAEALYALMGTGVEMSGGSAANTAAGIASLGGRAAYIGKVRNDQLGAVFRHDLTGLGVHFATPAGTSGPATARCLIFVTPDAQRTMNTYLGACIHLGPNDVDEELIAGSKIVYLEGYLWDKPEAKAAFIKAAEIAHQHGRQVALTLSDSFCVNRHRESFRELVSNHIDILFANEHEIAALYEVTHFDDSLQYVRRDCAVAALTRSEKGSVIVAGDEVHVIDAEKISPIVDTTGAGDLYASGFLFGMTHENDWQTCGRLGGLAAAEVISHYGARPIIPLHDFIRGKLHFSKHAI
ncbi:MAG: adenosine kinase [Alphaproteobacteria bacterium]